MSAHFSPLKPLDSVFARVLGIQLSYVNNDGVEIKLEHDTFDKIAREILPASLEFSGIWDEAFLEKLLRHKYSRHIPENAVVWGNAELVIDCFSVDEKRFRSLKGELLLENGSRQNFDIAAVEWKRVGGVFDGHLNLPLFEARIKTGIKPGLGYHMITTSEGEVCQVICAPEKLPKATEKSWGAFVPAYALRSKDDWGSGSYTELGKLSMWLAELGAKTVATLPLLPSFLEDWKCDPSPYSPASRLFWNEFYIDPQHSPEWMFSTEAQKLVAESAAKIAEWKNSEYVPYYEIACLKRKVLAILTRTYFASGDKSRLEKACKKKPKLVEYARFRAHCFETKSSWWCWPEEQKLSLQNAKIDQGLVDFYVYSQMLALEQVETLAADCAKKDLSFYLDLPVGVHSDSYDVWKNPTHYCLKLSAGAPPDPFFTKGQDWGFPPLRPSSLLESRLSHFKEILNHHLSQASLLRLDHVMGFHRIYVVPHGMGADRGAYIRFPFEELYAVLLLEASRAGARLVGEDLGTVPEEVRKSMDVHLLSRLFVFQYEAHPSKEHVVNSADSNTVATLNTHDMPMWAAYWNGLDLPDRLDLGLLNATTLLEEQETREILRKKWIAYLHKTQGLDLKPSDQDVFQATMLFVAGAPSELALVTLEDVWLEERPQNTPGTYMERKNWQRKCRLSLEEIQKDVAIRSFLNKISFARKSARST
ncbi:MAG: 4-alpha-glucanotransferase [Bdellovibrionota bacterium]